MGRPLRVLAILAVATATGCSYVVEEGVRALVGDEGPPQAQGPRAAGPDAASRPSTTVEEPPAATVSTIQHAPTLDWKMGVTPLPHAPGRSIFQGMAARRMPCQAVPVGLAQAFSGPTGSPSAPLQRWGPIEIGVTGPDRFADGLAMWSGDALSGAWMQGDAFSCSTRMYLYLRLGHASDEVSVLR